VNDSGASNPSLAFAGSIASFLVSIIFDQTYSQQYAITFWHKHSLIDR
jgi:hypothetical protein